jgi:Mg/Co/Ni transporter MgtE
MKGKMIVIRATGFIMACIWAAIIYIYWYPWLYNQVNHYTERSEDLDENIDFVNTFIMFIVSTLTIFILATLTGGLIYMGLKQMK